MQQFQQVFLAASATNFGFRAPGCNQWFFETIAAVVLCGSESNWTLIARSLHPQSSCEVSLTLSGKLGGKALRVSKASCVFVVLARAVFAKETTFDVSKPTINRALHKNESEAKTPYAK